METMKTITPSLNGLASSLLLNLGFSKAAEKLDPVAVHQTKHDAVLSGGPCVTCVPSAYMPRNRR